MTNQKELKIELRGECEVVFMRYFDATPEMLFDCHTKPELMRRWLTPPEGWVSERFDVDLRIGGRFVHIGMHPQQGRFGIYGTFKEIKRPERFVSTESFMADVSAYNAETPDDPNCAIQTYTFTAHGEQMLMTQSLLYPTAEIRKAALDTGMADGMCETCEKLDALIAAAKG